MYSETMCSTEQHIVLTRDSLQQDHFFRAAFYFNAQVNTDSLAPIYAFIKEDLQKMLLTFEWKK